MGRVGSAWCVHMAPRTAGLCPPCLCPWTLPCSPSPCPNLPSSLPGHGAHQRLAHTSPALCHAWAHRHRPHVIQFIPRATPGPHPAPSCCCKCAFLTVSPALSTWLWGVPPAVASAVRGRARGWYSPEGVCPAPFGGGLGAALEGWFHSCLGQPLTVALKSPECRQELTYPPGKSASSLGLFCWPSRPRMRDREVQDLTRGHSAYRTGLSPTPCPHHWTHTWTEPHGAQCLRSHAMHGRCVWSLHPFPVQVI